MVKICFFSVGFAFNRLVRMRYYEEIFPKDTEIFLITTNKYNDSDKWKLKRTKLKVIEFRPLGILLDVRKFCMDNNIDIVTNLGHPFGAVPLIFAKLFQNRKNYLFFFGDVMQIFKFVKPVKRAAIFFFSLIPYFILSRFSEKLAFVGKASYKKAPVFFMKNKKSVYFLHAPVDTNLFVPRSKIVARKKLNIEPDKKVILYVGRISLAKGGDLLIKMIVSNPDVQFFVIGKWLEKDLPLFKAPNMILIDKKSSQELVDYYNAADLSFCIHRQGDQTGIVGEESLACGTPIIHTKRIAAKDSPSIFKVNDSIKEINKAIRSYFSFPKEHKKRLSKEARNYAERYCSNTSWESAYSDFYIN